MYSIGEVAQMLGISTHTLRYYEKEQIILPDRNENGERLYSESHIQWLRFVLKLKETQMPVNKIKEYAHLYTEGEHTSLARLDLLVEHKQSIEHQLKTLEDTNKMLEQKISFYKEVIRNKNIVKQ
ncbi:MULTISPECIES: MerR family transcriptional regulator [unclassified Bacillus (in: firmicutes)]|uniref:MerR family transcriptional regulator n=1 Tax=unclassified Bacillus (in: firmicutes) TaxID=185979 RepID=UPI0008F0E50A|nr:MULTISPECIES: MerR family transcriptional regulator [unclassified Bacillus (in: firmicutes)]PGZ90676.1 MerR family transcriptional regulator [Bacillus sp. AFS029533]SFD29718.1 DNA-binding transcriptional regulator, MerR family [Bacillus sp. UNCCL81]